MLWMSRASITAHIKLLINQDMCHDTIGPGLIEIESQHHEIPVP